MQRKISIILSLALLLGCMPFDTVSAEKIFSWIIEPSMVYDNIYSFRDGLAGVRRGGDELRGEATDFYYNNYHGVINDQGKEIIPPSEGNPKYGWDSSIEGGYVLLPKDGETTVYNYDGGIVSVLPYNKIEYLENGLFEAETEEDYNIINEQGDIIVQYQKILDNCNASEFGNSLIKINQTSLDYSEKKIDIYDHQGNCVMGDMEDITRFYDFNNTNYTYTYYGYGVKKGGKYGLIDNNAALLTDICYDTMEYQTNGEAIVKKNGSAGLIDKSGNEVIPCEYDTIGQFKNDKNSGEIYYKVGKDQLYGLITGTSKVVVPVNYLSVEEHSGVFACKSTRGTDDTDVYDYYSETGTKLAEAVDGAGRLDFLNGYSKKLSEKYYVVPGKITDEYGNCLYESDEDIRAELIDDDSIMIYTIFGRKGKLLKIAENELHELPYEATTVCGGGLIIAESNGVSGVIDTDGGSVIPFEYENIYEVSNNTFLRVMKNGKYGIADYSGNIIVPCEYDSLYADESWGSYYKNRIKGTKDGATYYGYIDDDNKLVVPCIYDDVYKGENGFIVESGGLEGIIGLDGTAVTDIIYENISFFKEQYIIFRQNGLNGLLDMNGDILLPPVYDSIDSGGKDRFLVHYQGKYGILNRYGDIILPIEYDDVYFQEPGGGNYSAYYDGCLCIFYKDTDTDGIKDTCGLMDPNGSIFLDCEYEEIYTDSEIIRVKDKNGLWGLARIEEKMPVMVETAPENGMLKVSIENSGNYQGKLIAVFYQNGQYIETEQREIQSGIYEEQFTVPQEADSYKVFVWDSLEGMEPMSFSQSGELSGS